MIYGEYQLGKRKLDLSKNKNFKKFFPSTGIRYVYKTGLNENTFRGFNFYQPIPN